VVCRRRHCPRARDDPGFMLVFQEKTPPYLVTIVEIHPESIAWGRADNRRAIDTYIECKDTGVWPDTPTTSNCSTCPRGGSANTKPHSKQEPTTTWRSHEQRTRHPPQEHARLRQARPADRRRSLPRHRSGPDGRHHRTAGSARRRRRCGTDASRLLPPEHRRESLLLPAAQRRNRHRPHRSPREGLARCWETSTSASPNCPRRRARPVRDDRVRLGHGGQRPQRRNVHRPPQAGREEQRHPRRHQRHQREQRQQRREAHAAVPVRRCCPCGSPPWPKRCAGKR